MTLLWPARNADLGVLGAVLVRVGIGDSSMTMTGIGFFSSVLLFDGSPCITLLW